MNNEQALQALAHLIGTPYEPSVKTKISEIVYDLNTERAIVSTRVAFVPRSAEIQALFYRFVPLITNSISSFSSIIVRGVSVGS